MGANISVFSDGEPIALGSSKLVLSQKNCLDEKCEEELNEVEISYISSASCFTVHQGCILEIILDPNPLLFTFDHSLALGSKYDISVVVTTKSGEETTERTFLHEVYCNNKPVRLGDIIKAENELSGTWQCSHCKSNNTKGLKICSARGCLMHKSHKYITIGSLIPVVGIPFGITLVIQKWAKACVQITCGSVLDAILETLFLCVDIVLTPLIICKGITALAKVACKLGVSCVKKLCRRLGVKGIYHVLKPVLEPMQAVCEPIRTIINKNRKSLIDQANNI